MLLIYWDKAGSRRKYIFQVILKEILNIEYNTTTSREAYLAYDGPKLSYATSPLDDSLFFQSFDLLDQIGIDEQPITIQQYKGNPVFFSVNHKQSAFPFDPFSASFYLVSRYEEYFPYIKDEFDRFPPQESLAFKHAFLNRPLVNVWAGWIQHELERKFPAFKIPGRSFTFTPTYDIDLAYAYREKGIARTLAGYLRSISQRDFREVIERTRVLSGRQKDPFDTYAYMQKLHIRHNLSPFYFVLYAGYGQYDKNTSVYNNVFCSLIKSLGDYGIVGIHPSYQSNASPGLLKEEIGNLSKVLNRDITHSRQHFLKLRFPDTYRNLIQHDILNDFSMGYASELGFRASICVPYKFYDLDMDVETKLTIHPFTFMEGTLRDYHNLEIPQAFEHIKMLIDEVRKVNGTLYTLWHNESLSNTKRWAGWNKLYEDMLQYIMQPGG